ncbi:MAG: nickel pincer cofactor biosynthesis protein LarB [Candidatus Omnitrophica bacterium]|nr:nickel pincer cofactor biosynthesis protein LarB [Candidatus Omnitrophota bacterium]
MNSNFDYRRCDRIGMPECIYCASKDPHLLQELLAELCRKKPHPILLTRLSEETFEKLDPAYTCEMNYDAFSETAFLHGVFPKLSTGLVSVVTAGTGDLSVATETTRTLEYLGVPFQLFPDIGVAGLWRIEGNLEAINRAHVIVVIAGMDAAIVSVLGGLTPKPLIAVPTSVGYGVAQGGQCALNSMLSSCAPGVTVMNIDNGYGAACAAFRIIKQIKPT